MKKPKTNIKYAKNIHFLRVSAFPSIKSAFLSTFSLTDVRICDIIESTKIGENIDFNEYEDENCNDELLGF